MMSSGDGGEGGVAATAQPALPGSVPDSDAGESGTGDTVEEGRSAEPVADAATATAAVSQRTGSADELLLPPRPESGLQAEQKEEGKLHSQARDRDAALRSEGANAEAWQWFQELDTDNSGGLDEKELQLFLKKKVKLTRYLNRDTIEKAFVEMDGRTKGYVTFAEFVKWFNSLKERERRQMRRKVRDLFESIDKDHSGRLDKAEFAKLATKGKDLLGIHPPFDLEKDWAACEHTVYQDMEPEVTYQGFEKWWKSRLGLDSEFPDIPVLPEFMVQRVSEVSEKLDKREHRGASLSVKRRGHTGPLTGKDLWKIIRPRILSIVRMQNQWGGIHQIYQANSSSAESIYESSPVPKWTRDPDSAFSAAWDMIQVFLLFYVAVAVPLRAGFDLTTPLWSFGFFFDLCVDIYFVADIVLNFRTAHYNRDGSREDRPHHIAAYYVRGWFAIDFISCLPLSYISYFGEEDVAVVAVNMSTAEDNAGGGSGFRAMKALRLVRLWPCRRHRRRRSSLFGAVCAIRGLAHTRCLMHQPHGEAPSCPELK
jgi:Ca2+-binding EF-hand superfamily protein